MIDEPTNAPINEDDKNPATKGDVRRSQEELAAIVGKAFAKETNTLRSEMQEMKKDLLLDNQKFRKELLADNKKTRQHFDVVAENIHKDVAEANQDEITLIKDQQIPNLDTRTQALEKNVGLPVGSVRQ